MHALFVYALGLGAVVLIAQIVLSALGLVTDLPDALGDSGGDGLELLSVRTIAAGAVGFGAGGLAVSAMLPPLLALPVALGAGLATAAATAYLSRMLFRLESSGNLRLDEAPGQIGTVYLPVPAANEGTGLVQFTLQGRTVELRAYTRERTALPTGAAVLVISIDSETETAEVIPTTDIEGLQ
jgi:hypothetical protein